MGGATVLQAPSSAPPPVAQLNRMAAAVGRNHLQGTRYIGAKGHSEWMSCNDRWKIFDGYHCNTVEILYHLSAPSCVNSIPPICLFVYNRFPSVVLFTSAPPSSLHCKKD
jgi:hypothetical protein